MSEKDLRRAIRHKKKRNRLGVEAICEQCGECDVRALRQVGEWILCAECHLSDRGKSYFELHHVAGRANDGFSIRIPANDHTLLSDAQQDWPESNLRNESDNPLIKMIAMTRGSHDVYLHVIEQAPKWTQMIEEINAYLTDREGPDWFIDFQQWMDK